MQIILTVNTNCSISHLSVDVSLSYLMVGATSCSCLYLSLLVLHLAAVKFGRMSKRQREIVQDEVKYHKRNRSNSSDSGTTSGSDTDLTDS